MDRRRFGQLLFAGAMAPAPMKIVDARLYHLKAPTEQPVRTSFGAMTERHLVLLELRDESGNRGYGESWINFPSWAPEERKAAFSTAFLPYLRGKEVVDVASFFTAMVKAFRGPAIQSGTLGPLVSSLCAVEMALIELAAKRKGVSISKLLFPAPAGKVRIYASGVGTPLPWKWIDSHLDRGVDLFKLKIGFDDAADLSNIRQMKERLGSKARLAVDVNRNWTFGRAREWVKRLGDFGVEWLEEPLTVEDEHRTAELAGISPVTIAGGENVLIEPGGDISRFTDAGFTIVQPDVTKYCTTHDFLRLLPEAARKKKRVVPHLLGSAPGQAFALHLASGCPDRLCEWDINANPLHTEVFAEGFHIAGGSIEIPQAPGLGWTPKLKDSDRVA